MHTPLAGLAALLASCLHAQTPVPAPHDAAKATITRLVNDPDDIAIAAELVKERRLPREAWIGPVTDAYWSWMRAGIHDKAAELAWRFGLGAWYIGTSLDFARREMFRTSALLQEKLYGDDEAVPRFYAERALEREVLIACRYGPVKASAALAIQDAVAFHEQMGGNGSLWLLLDYGCPLEAELRDEIIAAAENDGRDHFALRHAAAATDWDLEKRTGFVETWFWSKGCDDALRAAARLGLPPEAVVPMIETAQCEEGTFDASGWAFAPADFGRFFFAAVRGEKWLLAYECLRRSRLGDDGLTYLFQEMTRWGWEYKLQAFLERHPELYERAMAYALEAGHVRLVGHFAKTPEMVRKAFDRGLALGKFMEAMLVAENGLDEAFMKEGPLLAFRAAMEAGAYEDAVIIAKRHPDLIPKEERDRARDAWIAKKAGALERTKPEPRKRKRREPACADDDWHVQGCE